MSETLRLGVVGAGAVLQVAHLPVLRKVKGARVVALCDKDLPKARALASRHGIANFYDDIEDLLQHEELDALLICTPNHLHEAHLLAALSAGLHVFVEKPLALSTESAARIARRAGSSDRIITVGMNHRYRSDTQAIRSFVQSGELGRVDSIRAGWHMGRSSRAPLGWRQRPGESGGGVMFDLGLTMIDLAFWLAGNPVPKRVSAAMDPGTSGSDGVEQSGSAFIVCDDGLSIFVDVTWRNVGAGEYFGANVRGAKGSASLNPLRVWKEMHGAIHDVSPTTSGSRENLFLASFRAQWAHFLAAVRGEATVPGLDEQVKALRILEAVYESAASGRDVTL